MVYLNGDFVPLEDARISPLDRGFTFGDGVYEVIPVYNRHIFRLSEHLQRLQHSLELIYMSNPLPLVEWERVLYKLVAENEADDQSIYLQVSRGISARDHAISDKGQATVFIMTKPLLQPDNAAGSAAIVRQDIRWQWCHIKAITLLPSVLLRYEAQQAGAREAILIRDGEVTEGAASNVFICKAGRVMTPPKSERLLAGITRDLVIELLHKAAIECEERPLTESELRQADEIWITSSTQEIVPIISLDNQPVGRGQPGPLWQRATRAYQQFKQEFSSDSTTVQTGI